MFQDTENTSKEASALAGFNESFTDFILSRKAMLCSPSTIKWYEFTLRKILEFFVRVGIKNPEDIKAQHVRRYLSSLTERNLSDSYINNHARAIRTLLRFWYAEKYHPDLITFQMPKISSKHLPVLSVQELDKAISACDCPRDKALLLLLVDSGLRRAEVCSLNWGNIDIQSGLVRVVRGKGGKARSVVIGVRTRRALLAYHRIAKHNPSCPAFQTNQNRRISHNGLRSILLRISNRANVHITPHALRRTFATLSIRSGMNLLHLQGLLGHSSVETTRKYVNLVDDDFIQAHKAHGPIDSFM